MVPCPMQRNASNSKKAGGDFTFCNGIDWAFVISTRDFPSQASLPFASLSTTIGRLINSNPAL